MDDDAPVIYGLEFQARALTAQVAETDTIRFLVGTQSLRFENQIHLIDFDDENNLINKNVFTHGEGEIWHISSSTVDKNVFATCFNKTAENKAELDAAVWRIPTDFESSQNDDTTSNVSSVELLSRLRDYGDVKCTIWHPSGEESKLISLADNNIVVWDLDASGSNAKVSNQTALEAKGHGQRKFTSGKWNPNHNCTQIATANDTCIRGWDLRTMSQAYIIENAHAQLVRDLDFNPNKQYYLASCGDDCKAKFWDIRNPSTPLKVLTDHSHWIWSIRYNHFHDQLVLTSSSDSQVILNNMVSISSEPFGHLAEEDELDDAEEKEVMEREPMADRMISCYEEHEDSVYAVEWSTADPWLFASLSNDGRLVINRVPRAEKYKILL